MRRAPDATRTTTVAANGPPPDGAAMLCDGQVMHARMRPAAHRFSYRVASILIDIDRLDEADRLSLLFSVGRFNLFSFEPGDHGFPAPAAEADAGPGADASRDRGRIRRWIDRELAAAGLAAPPARVLLLAAPRVLGFVFNPISVYFCFDAAGRTVALVHEVRSTFGGHHAYALPVGPGEADDTGIRQSAAKLLHVSPFIPMDMRYHFRVLPPGGRLRVRILETDRDGPLLAATWVASVAPLTSAALGRSFWQVPLVGAKILAAIHVEALRLWLKGVRFFGSRADPVATPTAGRGAGLADVAPRSGQTA